MKSSQQIPGYKCRLMNYFKHKCHILSIITYLQQSPENLVGWHGKNFRIGLILESICRKSKRSTNVNMQITTSVGGESVVTAVCQKLNRKFLHVFNH